MATTQQQIDSTTQKFLDIYDITNDLVILKDGTSSLIITVDAMNFGLLAEEEQDSIMYAYAGLLNSLNYPIQIIIKSQTKDVTGYLRLLKEQEDAALNNVHRQRIMKYREFVSNLIRERNVLDKKFYVAIPAKPLEIGLVPISGVLPGKSQTDVASVDKTMVIEKAKSILEPKRDHLIAQFARIGLYSRQLETQEIIQMFYQSYNPEAFEGQSMDDSRSYTAPLVSASIQGFSMDNQTDLSQPATAVAQPVPSSPVSTEPMQSNTVDQQPAAAMDPATQPTANQMPTTPAEVTTGGAFSIPPANTVVGSVADTTTQSTPTFNQAAPSNTSGYTPTQMTQEIPTPAQPVPSNPVSTEPMQSNTVDQQPAAAMDPTTQPTANQMPTTPVEATTGAPLPPMPELPKTSPGQVDPSVPQEVEIKIEHPSEKSLPDQDVAGQSSSTQDSASETAVVEPTADTSQLPPLPEIK